MMVSDMSLGFLPGTNANFLSPNESSSISPPQDATIAPWISAQDDEPVSIQSSSCYPLAFILLLAHTAPQTKPAAHTHQIVAIFSCLGRIHSFGESRQPPLRSSPPRQAQ